jgi:hypothetical protein
VSSHDCSLPYDYFLYIDDERTNERLLPLLDDERTNDYFLYVDDERTNDYFLYVNYERMTTSTTAGLHCDHPPASTVYGYTD